MSESETPLLPEGDDPFLLLGLDETTATPLSCKRAWTRLIKRYRPDRDPEAFARIRIAYEAALEHVAEREARARWEDDERSDEVGDEADGQRPEAPAGAPADEPHETAKAPPWMQPSSPASSTLEQEDDAEAPPPPAAPDGTKLVDLARQAEAARGGDRDRAYDRLRQRVDALLLEDRLPELVDEADDPALLDLAARDVSLAWPLIEVVCAAAWSRPDDAEALLHRMVRAGVADKEVVVVQDVRRSTRDAWLAWRARHGHLEALARFLEVGPALGYAALRSEARAVVALARQRPGETVAALGALGEEDEDLLVQVWDTVEAAREGGGEEAEEDDARKERQAPTVRAALVAANKSLRHGWRQFLHFLGILILIALTDEIFERAGAWGWGGVAAAFVWLFAGQRVEDVGVYRAVLRPRLAALVAQTGCRVPEMLEVVREKWKRLKRVDYFSEVMEEDAGLELLAAIVAIGGDG